MDLLLPLLATATGQVHSSTERSDHGRKVQVEGFRLNKASLAQPMQEHVAERIV